MTTPKSLEEAIGICSVSHPREKPCDVCEAIAKTLDRIKDGVWAAAESDTRKRVSAWLIAADKPDLGNQVLSLVPNARKELTL